MENSLYFFITYTSKEKENDFSNFLENLECIVSNENFNNNYYSFNKIYKVSKSDGNSNHNYCYEFEIDNNKYCITFNNKDKTFIFDVCLTIKGKYLMNICPNIIDQNRVNYSDKLEYFINALEKDKKMEKINELYKEAIDLLYKKGNFDFLIYLFIKVYKDKELCSLLFKNIRKLLLNETKMFDRNKNLKIYESNFNKIIQESKQLIEKNNYNMIDFYGLILCYYNYYDYENFTMLINSIYKENPETLYEILIIYKIHMINEINQNMDFFDNFLNYAIKKEEFTFIIDVFNYITDLEIFLCILDKNKENIWKKTIMINSRNVDINKNIIIINGYLNMKKIGDNEEETEGKSDKKFISIIKSIIQFSLEKNIFFTYFKNNFWKNILSYFNKPKFYYIYNCYLLRQVFIQYHQLVLKIFEKEKKLKGIKKEAMI